MSGFWIYFIILFVPFIWVIRPGRKCQICGWWITYIKTTIEPIPATNGSKARIINNKEVYCFKCRKKTFSCKEQVFDCSDRHIIFPKDDESE